MLKAKQKAVEDLDEQPPPKKLSEENVVADRRIIPIDTETTPIVNIAKDTSEQEAFENDVRDEDAETDLPPPSLEPTAPVEDNYPP